MKSVSPYRSYLQADWKPVEAGMKVVKLGLGIKVLVPFLALASFSKSTRGLSLYPGRGGVAIGTTLMAAGAAIGYELFASTGAVGALLALWLLGTAGAATLVSSQRPTAFIKPICVQCRLLPVIKEHEAIHLTGVASERAVWASMKTRHSPKGLSLDGDPSICPFCPIPKRLSEH